MAKPDWDIPQDLQPDPAECGFDLDRALRAVVGVSVRVPEDAMTATTLGTERSGSGVVIRADGLVLTIGYLVAEAASVWLSTHDGRAVAGDVLAYDHATGFGLIQPLGRLGLPHLETAEHGVEVGATVVCAASGGRHHAIRSNVVARHEFAGYWEYMLDDALFIAPAHPFWSGAALIGPDGRLLGVGSLILQREEGRRARRDMNMVVPSWLLRPILEDLLRFGRSSTPPRPWLGLNAVDGDEGIVIGALTAGGPSEIAGVQVGDRILAVNDDDVTELAELWRKIWGSGTAGSKVLLRLQRDNRVITIVVASVDRERRMQAPRLH